jgi:hypothetical protein
MPAGFSTLSGAPDLAVLLWLSQQGQNLIWLGAGQSWSGRRPSS